MASAPVGLKAEVVCQRFEESGGFAETVCDKGLRRGDRFRVQFEVSRTAFVYIYLFNDTGQFQMSFPSVGDDNRASAGQRHTLPHEGGWYVVEGPSGVEERVRLVASGEPVTMLEPLRGVVVPPRGSEIGADERGRIEPLVIRDWRPPTRQETDQATSTAALSAEMVEFLIPYL